MPQLEVSDLGQKAVLWAFSSYNKAGDPVVSAAVEIDVRWQAKRKQVIDALGNPIILEAQVAVDREIAVNSILWKGELDDAPDPPTNLFQVVAYNEVPDVSFKSTRRVVDLTRYSDTLPTTA